MVWIRPYDLNGKQTPSKRLKEQAVCDMAASQPNLTSTYRFPELLNDITADGNVSC